ncbi:hypothetical protein B0H13DRAFT_2266469 [Mycena leptocephala]|nr:hypothetical protein B0H13DRAFT_2266469 [Mycena leptocephala]
MGFRILLTHGFITAPSRKYIVILQLYPGGTLSEYAARERIGGTFHSGNVPGLAPTNLGKDTCLCSLRTPLLFLLPPPPLAPTSPPTRQKSAKMTTDGTDNSKHMVPTNCSLIRTRSRYVNLTFTPPYAYITSSRTHLTFPTTNVPALNEFRGHLQPDFSAVGISDFNINEASQNPDNVVTVRHLRKGGSTLQQCSNFASLAHAHISRGATAGDHRELQVEAQNFLLERSARSDVFEERYTRKVKRCKSIATSIDNSTAVTSINGLPWFNIE